MRSIGFPPGSKFTGCLALLSTASKIDRVFSILSECKPVIVAFSGGVDSTLVLKLAVERLGPSQVLAVTGISPSIPKSEQEEARILAAQVGSPFHLLNTEEMQDENYLANTVNRCYFCKQELFKKLNQLAETKGYKTVLDGTNADDAGDWRPGMKAAQELSVRSPLLEAGLTKSEIRELSRNYNLPTWDKPAMPCLSSRIPHGEGITLERLDRVEKAERILRNHGFSELRVRDHYPIARIEVPVNDLPRLIEEPLRSQIVQEIKSIGYRFVSLELAGLKSGSLNP